MSMSDIVKITNSISREQGFGELNSAVTNAFFGINHRGLGNAVPNNNDHYGLTFFTRPRMNLSYDNITAFRPLTNLLTDNPLTVQRAVRAYLDPDSGRRATGAITTPLVDPYNAFIPLLSNTLTSLSGWPDSTVDTYTSTEGMHREAWSMVDGVSLNRRTFDITANFRNVVGDPITLLFHSWMHYAACVYGNIMTPYPDMIIENEIDYNTRIYRLVLDPSRRFVQKIAATGAAFPIANSIGNAFNMSNEKPITDENNEISIPFRCIGVDYLDPILMLEFNKTVEIFNPYMKDGVRGYNSMLVEVQAEDRNKFNYRGYPHIDLETCELTWWVFADDYKRIMGV